MSSVSDPLRERLNPEEPLTAEFTATLSEDSRRTSVAVGITDRRILCASENDGMISVGYDSICAIRSDSRTNHSYRGIDYRLLMGAGGLVALLGLVGMIGFSASALVPTLAVLFVGGVVTADYLWRHPDAVDWDVPDELRERAARVDERFEVRRFERRVTDYADEHRSLLVGGALLGLVAYAGIALVAPRALVLGFALLLGGGIATMDYAYANREDFDGIEVVPQRKTEIAISTSAGSTIHITSDAAEGIDRELSRLAFAPPFEAARNVSFPAH